MTEDQACNPHSLLLHRLTGRLDDEYSQIVPELLDYLEEQDRTKEEQLEKARKLGGDKLEELIEDIQLTRLKEQKWWIKNDQ